MAITTKKLAELAGVSRGTVDRVLHSRGRVAPEVCERVLAIAREHGFEVNPAGRALALAKNPVNIGVVMHLAGIPFFAQVREGLAAAEQEISSLGGRVLLEELPSLDPAAHIRAIDRLLEKGAGGIAVTPVQDAALVEKLVQLGQQGVEVVTFNTDIEGAPRRCFVGLDNHKSGRTAAGLAQLMLGARGGRVLVVSGSGRNPTNAHRVEGFLAEARARRPQMEIAPTAYNNDEEQAAFDIVSEALAGARPPDVIYMVSAGQAGACRALEQSGRAGEVRLIVFDTTPGNVAYIQRDVIDIIIDQSAFTQGALPPRILFDLLFSGKAPQNSVVHTDITIKTRHNL